MPRRPSASSSDGSSTNKPRVRFIFEPDRTSPNGITYSWLIHDAYGGKEKAATATRAFWLPFAYRHSGNYSEAELKDLAQQSIWQMEAQIQHLREEFGLGSSSTNVAVAELVGAPESAGDFPNASPANIPTHGMNPVLQDSALLDEFADFL